MLRRLTIKRLKQTKNVARRIRLDQTEVCRYIKAGREVRTADKFLKEMSMMRSGVMKYEFKYRVPY